MPPPGPPSSTAGGLRRSRRPCRGPFAEEARSAGASRARRQGQGQQVAGPKPPDEDAVRDPRGCAERPKEASCVPAHTDAGHGPSRAHPSVVTKSAACSVYQRLSSTRCGGSGSSASLRLVDHLSFRPRHSRRRPCRARLAVPETRKKAASPRPTRPRSSLRAPTSLTPETEQSVGPMRVPSAVHARKYPWLPRRPPAPTPVQRPRLHPGLDRLKEEAAVALRDPHRPRKPPRLHHPPQCRPGDADLLDNLPGSYELHHPPPDRSTPVRCFPRNPDTREAKAPRRHKSLTFSGTTPGVALVNERVGCRASELRALHNRAKRPAWRHVSVLQGRVGPG